MAYATREREMAAINITPLVDVMLVLLVIFMIAAPLLSRSLAMQLPQAAPARVEAPELTLQIDSAGGYRLDGQAVSAATLATSLQDALARAPDLRLRIASAEDSDYQAFVGALAVAERAGVRNIGSQMR